MNFVIEQALHMTLIQYKAQCKQYHGISFVALNIIRTKSVADSLPQTSFVHLPIIVKLALSATFPV